MDKVTFVIKMGDRFYGESLDLVEERDGKVRVTLVELQTKDSCGVERVFDGP